jgi:hypothetical protein
MKFERIMSLAAVAAAASLLSGPAQAATPAALGANPVGIAPAVDAVDFTKYSDNEKAVDAPFVPPAPPNHVRYVRNLASGRLPEPGAWTMMLIGFSGAGYLLRRNRRRARAAGI